MEQLFWIAYWIGFIANALALGGFYFAFHRGDFFANNAHRVRFLTLGAIGVIFSLGSWVVLALALLILCIYHRYADDPE